MKKVITSCLILLLCNVVLADEKPDYHQTEEGRIELNGSGPWIYPATRWGRYDVLARYAKNTGKQPLAFGARIGDAILNTNWQSDPKAELPQIFKVGTVRIEAEADIKISATLKDTTTGEVLPLEGLILSPACEGEKPVQVDSEAMVLHSRDATVLGTTLRYEPKPEKNTLGYWVRATDKAVWDFTIKQPGMYKVEVLQGCGQGQGGSDAVVRLGSRELPFVVEETGHFQNFVPREVGRIRIDKPGDYRLEIQPTKIKATAAMDVRQVTLIFVADAD